MTALPFTLKQTRAMSHLLAGGDCAALDMTAAEWEELTRIWEKFLGEERREAAHDERIAFDRKSVRAYDKDGRLRVELANISKANVCEYLGREIPDWERLNLDPDKKYKLLRDPKELEKAAATFDGCQLLIKHVPVGADDHRPDEIVGTTGTGTQYNHPYLQTPLIVWAQRGIDGIEAGTQKELSSGYHYRPDMTPGTYEGAPYDGVMRDIVGNHVALVEEGRAGADVVVGDSALPKLKEYDMTVRKAAPLSRKAAVLKGALLARVPALLAADAKAKLDTSLFDQALDGLTAKNYRERKPSLIEKITALLKPHLATDAKMEDLARTIDAFEPGEETEARDAGTEANSGLPLAVKPEKEAKDAETEEEEKKKREAEDRKRAHDAYRHARDAMTKHGVDASVIKACDEEMGYEHARDAEPEEEKKKREEREAEDRRRAKDSHVTKGAMDEAIAAATQRATASAIAQQRAIYEAMTYVRPLVGELALAFDSADQVYQKALSIMRPDLDLKTVHPSAYKTLLSVLPAKSRPEQEQPLGLDSAAAGGYAERFPEAKRLLQ